MKTAIILGATGLTGSLVLEQLIANKDYSKIKLFSRSAAGVNDPKVEEYIVDLLNLKSLASSFTADEVYCCIGTTKKKTPNQALYRDIDYGIPATAAKLCTANGIKVMSVVSAIGANSNSSIFYNRTKGEMEQAILNAGIERTYILRPSIIGGNRQEKRTGEKIGIAIFKFLKPIFVGKLKKYALIDASKIASKMIHLSNSTSPSCIIESNEI